MEKFYLPEGYKIELVASEPMVNEPVAIAWDGNGKMYVAQWTPICKMWMRLGKMNPLVRLNSW